MAYAARVMRGFIIDPARERHAQYCGLRTPAKTTNLALHFNRLPNILQSIFRPQSHPHSERPATGRS
jgi:hypothetical protein